MRAPIEQLGKGGAASAWATAGLLSSATAFSALASWISGSQAAPFCLRNPDEERGWMTEGVSSWLQFCILGLPDFFFFASHAGRRLTDTQPTTQTPVVQPNPPRSNLATELDKDQIRPGTSTDFPIPGLHHRIYNCRFDRVRPNPATAPPRWWGTETRPDRSRACWLISNNTNPPLLAGFPTRIGCAGRLGFLSRRVRCWKDKMGKLEACPICGGCVRDDDEETPPWMGQFRAGPFPFPVLVLALLPLGLRCRHRRLASDHMNSL